MDWPSFLTFTGLNTIFLGYLFSSTNTKMIFWGTKTTNPYRIRSFWPQIPFLPRSFGVQFSMASSTSIFRLRPNTSHHPPPPPPPSPWFEYVWHTYSIFKRYFLYFPRLWIYLLFLAQGNINCESKLCSKFCVCPMKFSMIHLPIWAY